MLCSDLRERAGMEGTRPITSLSATQDAVKSAHIMSALLALSPVQLVEFVGDVEAKRQGANRTTRSRGKNGQLVFKDSGRRTTWLTPDEVRKRFDLIVDEDIPIAYAVRLAERQRLERGLQVVIMRSDSILNDTASFFLSAMISMADPTGRALGKLPLPRFMTKFFERVERKVGRRFELVATEFSKAARDSTAMELLARALSPPGLSDDPMAGLVPPVLRPILHGTLIGTLLGVALTSPKTVSDTSGAE